MVITLPQDAQHARSWTGNARVRDHHFGKVRLSESPLDIKIWWKRHNTATRYLVGTFRLYLHALLSAGYVREIWGTAGVVILRFQRTRGRDIEIAVRRRHPALKIGEFAD